MPCLRRATSLAYTDADEDAERMVSVADGQAPVEGDDWVETHAGRPSNMDAAANAGQIGDIPDLDGDAAHAGAESSTAGKGAAPAETPDIDDIPDMEEDLEAIDDEATAATTTTAALLGDLSAAQLLFGHSVFNAFVKPCSPREHQRDGR